MKRILGVFLATAVAVVCLSVDSVGTQLAIRRVGGQGWGANTAYGALFDPSTPVSVRGKVLSVERFTPLRQMGYGLLVMVETAAEESIAVHVGPGWYVEDQDFPIQKGDAIAVRGSRITFNEAPAIIATQIQIGEKLLLLRRADGVPVWSEDEESGG